MIDARYKKNIDNIFTEETQNKLLTTTCGVIGCGGTGGYILEFLVRLGVKKIHCWDGDTYCETNLNRQYGSKIYNINKNKAISICEELININNTVELIPHNWYCSSQEIDKDYLQECDIIILACDNSYNATKTRKLIRDFIIKGTPVIDGAVLYLGGWVSIITKKDLSLYDNMTQNWTIQGDEAFGSRPAYKCAIIAGEMVNQLVKLISGSRYAMIDSKLNIDIYHHKYQQSDKTGDI